MDGILVFREIDYFLPVGASDLCWKNATESWIAFQGDIYLDPLASFLRE
jgi:hypothetical protein